MTFLRLLEDWEVKSIFEVQMYLDSMEKIDAEKRNTCHNMQRQFPRGYTSFQEIARREMVKQKKCSVILGLKISEKWKESMQNNQESVLRQKLMQRRFRTRTFGET